MDSLDDAGHLGNLVELLEAWMALNRRSPLDGTISCKICRAMVLESNADGHYEWHANDTQRYIRTLRMAREVSFIAIN
jgi:hypothetical protein